MRIGIIQTAPWFGDKEFNIREIERAVGDLEADLWVMPELALTGYEFQSREELAELAEEIPGGETCRWLLEFCEKHNTHAVLGLAERDGEKLYNSCVLAAPFEIVGHYRKLHLFDEEKNRFDPGNLPLSVHDIGLARIGLMICFDWRYPEVARSLTLLGAQVIAHPSNLVAPFCQAAMITRALENRVFFVTTNRIGTEERAGRKVKFTGGSVLVDPDGETILNLPYTRTAVRLADIEPERADDKRATPHNDLIADRRPTYYLNQRKT